MGRLEWPFRRLRDRTLGLVRTLGAVLRPGRAERELDEEHAFHIEMETEKRIRQGMDPAEARRQARVAFGGVGRWQEEVRAARWTAGLEGLWRDARYAFRSLAARPLFSGVVVLTLAVSIGATTAIFGVVDAVLLRPLRVSAPDRLVGVEVLERDGGVKGIVSYPDFVDLEAASGAAFTGLAAHYLSDVALSAGDRADAALGVFASASYFSVLRLVPAAGRFFTAAEASAETPGAVAVLSHDLWRSRYGGEDVVGREIHVNGRALTVVGVAPEGFHGAMLGARPAVWLPIGLYPALHPGRDIRSRTQREWLQLFGRLADGVDVRRAQSVLGAAAAGLAEVYDYPDELVPAGVRLTPFKGLPPGVQDNVARVLALLFVAAGLLLLIAAVNIAGMLLARGTARGRELGVRKALGAARSRLVRQLSLESLLLGLAGAALGLVVAAVGARALGRVQPPGADGFVLDVEVGAWFVGFAFLAGAASAVAFGLLPAIRATAGDARSALADAGGAPASTRLRSTLVGGQVALTLVLLISTALLVRTIWTSLNVDHGFDPEGVVLAEVNLRLNGYDPDRGRAFYRGLLTRLDAAPEVEAAAIATAIPLGLGYDQTRVQVPGFEPPEPSGFPVGYSAVTPGYFATLGLPFRAGGPFEAGPRPGPVQVVINQAFANRFWPGGNAVGRTVTFNGSDAVIAGVVPTGRYRAFNEEARLYGYVSFDLGYSPSALVLFRPRGARAPAVAAFRRTLADLDPRVPAVAVTTLDRAMSQGLFLQQVAAVLVGLFAGVGLLLAATGIFGTLAFAVEQRRREIGVRMAVGASTGLIIRSVVGSGLRPVAVGAVLGLAGAVAASGVLTGMLQGVSPRDPLSFAAAVATLLAVAGIAAYLPARRATRVDPASVLRVE